MAISINASALLSNVGPLRHSSRDKVGWFNRFNLPNIQLNLLVTFEFSWLLKERKVCHTDKVAGWSSSYLETFNSLAILLYLPRNEMPVPAF